MKKKYIKPNTEIIFLNGGALMITGSERTGSGEHSGEMLEGDSGTEDTNEGGEIEIDAKSFGHNFNIWAD